MRILKIKLGFRWIKCWWIKILTLGKQKKSPNKPRSLLPVIAWSVAAYRPWGCQGEFTMGRGAALTPSRKGLRLLHCSVSHNDPTWYFCNMKPTNSPCLFVSKSGRCELAISWQRKVSWSLSNLFPKHAYIVLGCLKKNGNKTTIPKAMDQISFHCIHLTYAISHCSPKCSWVIS